MLTSYEGMRPDKVVEHRVGPDHQPSLVETTMADFQHSTPTPDENPTPFAPTDWLSHFESVGGGFLATDSQTSLCVAYQGNSAENQSAAHAMLRDLTDDQRAAVITHIRGRAGLSGPKPDLNAIPLEKLSEPAGTSQPSSGPALDQERQGSHDMDMTHAFKTAMPIEFSPELASGPKSEFQIAAQAWAKAREAIENHSGDEDIPRELCDAQSDAWQTMLDTPAPDIAALRFKLEHLLQVEPAVDAINAWGGTEVRQTLADVARLMASSFVPAQYPCPQDASDLSVPTSDADEALISAFNTYRARWSGDESVATTELRDAERTLLETPAGTVRGMEVKLRVLVEMLVSEQETSKQGLEPAGSKLIERKEIGSFDERLLFLVAQDAQRLAGQVTSPSTAPTTEKPAPLADFWAMAAELDSLNAKPAAQSTDQDYERAGALVGLIMVTPSPTPLATKWKLDHVLSNGNCYDDDLLAPVKAEYARWLEQLEILGNHAQPVSSQAIAWDAGMARLVAAQEECDAHAPLSESDPDGDDRLVRVVCDREHDLMELLAPHMTAFRWKMDQFRRMSEGHMIEPVAFDAILRDVEHLLRGAAIQNAYFAELDALDALGRNIEDLPESEGDRWEAWSIRLWGEIAALPASPENAKLKARAVWSIMGGDLDDLGEGNATSIHLARQIIASLNDADIAHPGEPANALTIAKSEPDRSAWDRAYHVYRGHKFRMDAYYALGPMDWANQDWDRAKADKDDNPLGFEKAHAQLLAEETASPKYYEPVDAAAIALIKLPAPDLDAVAIKIQLHKDHIESCKDDRIVWGYIEDDLRRLAA